MGNNRISMEATYQWEPIEAILKEANIRDLIVQFWEELSPVKDSVPLDPDWDRMVARERQGYFKLWTARVDGNLAGFIAFDVFPHLAYRQTLFALDCGHYLAPQYRDKGWAGYKMWARVIPALKEMGVKVVHAHDNHVHPLDSFFEKLGFEARSTIFWRYTDD